MLLDKILQTPSLLTPEIRNPEKQEEAKKYFVQIKRALEEIYSLMMHRDPSLQAKTKSILWAMLNQLNVCPSGLQSSLSLTKSDLLAGDISLILAKFRLKIIHDYHAILLAKLAANGTTGTEENGIHLYLID